MALIDGYCYSDLESPGKDEALWTLSRSRLTASRRWMGTQQQQQCPGSRVHTPHQHQHHQAAPLLTPADIDSLTHVTILGGGVLVAWNIAGVEMFEGIMPLYHP